VSRGASEVVGARRDMDRMEAELEAELPCMTTGRPPRWRDRQRRQEPRPRGGGGLRPHADEGNRIKSPPHGGMSALELERRLHQLRHEARIAELGCEANGGGGKGSTWAR